MNQCPQWDYARKAALVQKVYMRKRPAPAMGTGRNARNNRCSEVDLGSQLHAARGAIGADLAERADRDVGAGVAVGLHQIERVEGFQTELQLRLSLAQDVETLHQAGVQVTETGSADDAAAGIARTIGVLGHGRETDSVEVRFGWR